MPERFAGLPIANELSDHAGERAVDGDIIGPGRVLVAPGGHPARRYVLERPYKCASNPAHW